MLHLRHLIQFLMTNPSNARRKIVSVGGRYLRFLRIDEPLTPRWICGAFQLHMAPGISVRKLRR